MYFEAIFCFRINQHQIINLTVKKVAINFLALMTLGVISCTQSNRPDLTGQNLIPQPVEITATNQSFAIQENTKIFVQNELPEIQGVAKFLSDFLQPATGFALPVELASAEPTEGILFSINEADSQLGEEGYELNISENMVKITAAKPAGLFYAVQTLRQLLPASFESKTKQDGKYLLATGVIRDYPQYAFRGMMLDVARHFFTVDEVKKVIDMLAAYKLNVLHLHLSDDQGWRIEIKSWPNLTAHGGSTEVGGGEGGFYTQEQYSDIVRYAAERFIIVIPEIDMPGHTNAALASYAELNCDGKATELYTGIKVGFSSLCIKKEITYQFINDVVSELVALTPGPYFHIGGDESHATPIEEYIPFINRVQEIVKAHGKKVIGWDEIAHANLIENTFVQYWAKADNAKKGVEQGAQVILSPASKAYLDMQYDSTSTYGLHWAGYVEVDSAYVWSPETLVPGISRENILGVESPLWSETVSNIDEMEYLVFPRLLGHAEIGWSPVEKRNWEDYKLRLAAHGKRMEAQGVDFYRSATVPWSGTEEKK